MKLPLYNTSLKQTGTIDVKDGVFVSKVNKSAIYDFVKGYLANQRSGTASCKNHSMVSGTTKKVYRQKGTGQARHGDLRANIYVGGGKAFGPRPRDYSHSVTKKVRQLALTSALTARALDGHLIVAEDIPLKEAKTKMAFESLNKLDALDSVIITEDKNENLVRAVRNLPKVDIFCRKDLNAYAVLQHKRVVILKPALDMMEKLAEPVVAPEHKEEKPKTAAKKAPRKEKA